MNVEEAASFIKPAKKKYVVTLTRDVLHVGMRNFERSLHVPVLSITNETSHAWCLSPGNPTKPNEIQVSSKASMKFALSKVCQDSLASRPLRIQFSKVGSTEEKLFKLIKDSDLNLILGRVEMLTSNHKQYVYDDEYVKYPQRWQTVRGSSIKKVRIVNPQSRIFLMIATDFIIGFDLASFVGKRHAAALQQPNFCPECQLVFPDPHYEPQDGNFELSRKSQDQLTLYDTFPMDSPLVSSMPYEPLELFLMSRHPKPLPRSNFGEIVHVWPLDIAASYFIVGAVAAIYSLMTTGSITNLKGLQFFFEPSLGIAISSALIFYATDLRTHMITPDLEQEINGLIDLNLKKHFILINRTGGINEELAAISDLQYSNANVNPLSHYHLTFTKDMYDKYLLMLNYLEC